MTTREPQAGAVGRRREALPDRPEVRRQPETKAFLATSEFWVTVIAIAGLFFAAYGVDDLPDADAWRWSALVAIAYVVSRGIAKAASQRNWRRDYFDER